jgi:hypothetical protein
LQDAAHIHDALLDDNPGRVPGGNECSLGAKGLAPSARGSRQRMMLHEEY